MNAEDTQQIEGEGAGDLLERMLPAEVRSVIRDWSTETHTLIEQALPKDIRVCEPGQYTLRASGKRVRVTLTLLSSVAAEIPQLTACQLAATAEMIHTATLIHDDVIDGGKERRGRPAARIIHGNKRTVLAGDAMLAYAIRILSSARLYAPMDELLDVVVDMLEGEYLQLDAQHQLPPSVETAMAINHGKTARLFGWCMAAPWIHLGDQDARVNAARSFGEEMGAVFQRIDDVLDLVGDPDALGKEGLQDLREGKLTLPLSELLALDPSGLSRVEQIWECERRDEPVDDLLAEVRAWARAHGIEERTRADVMVRTDDALTRLAELPASASRDAIGRLTQHLVHRTH